MQLDVHRPQRLPHVEQRPKDAGILLHRVQIVTICVFSRMVEKAFHDPPMLSGSSYGASIPPYTL